MVTSSYMSVYDYVKKMSNYWIQNYFISPIIFIYLIKTDCLQKLHHKSTQRIDSPFRVHPHPTLPPLKPPHEAVTHSFNGIFNGALNYYKGSRVSLISLRLRTSSVAPEVVLRAGFGASFCRTLFKTVPLPADGIIGYASCHVFIYMYVYVHLCVIIYE